MQQSQNRILPALAFLLPLVAACDASEPPSLGKPAASAPVQQPVCAFATQARTKDELIAAIRSAIARLPWQDEERFARETAQISDDIAVVGAIALEISELALQPADCMPSSCYPLRFRQLDAIAGTSCDELDTFASWSFCKKLTLVNTTIRVRPVHIDGHPSTFARMPTVELRGACSGACQGLQCAANGICFASRRAYCQGCLGKQAQECACLDEAGAALAEGAECRFWVSGDQQKPGTCEAGLCDVW